MNIHGQCFSEVGLY